MTFTVQVISGKGVGKTLGFPTLNLVIPDSDFDFTDGIYAGWVFIDKKKHMGAFHLGPIPVFNDTKRSFEVFVLDIDLTTRSENVEVELIKHLRGIMMFEDPSKMAEQIEKDVKEVRIMLQPFGVK